jgi:hypothetical protein
MPVPRPEPWTKGTYVAAAAMVGFAAFVLWYAVAEPIFGLMLALLVLAGILFQVRDSRRLRRAAAERAGEGLCSFVRGFDRRVVDPWVLRATYEELQPFCRFRGGVLPLRATDRLEADLGIDEEELDDLARGIARRAWRSMDRMEANPVARVVTVRDLVEFLVHQPGAPQHGARISTHV